MKGKRRMKGIWYLAAAEYAGSYNGYTTENTINDYVKGTGIRHKRSRQIPENKSVKSIDKCLSTSYIKNAVWE